MDASLDRFRELLITLSRLRRRLALLAVASTLAGAAALATVLAGLALALEAVGYFPPAARTGTLGALAAAVMVTAATRARGTLSPLRSMRRFVLLLEAAYPGLRQRLVTAITLWEDPRARRLYSPDLLDATLADAATALASLDTSVLLDRRSLWRNLRAAVSAVAVLSAVLTLSPELRQAAVRYSHPLTRYARQPRTRVRVEPGDQAVIKGEDAPMVLRFSGRLPLTARIRTREDARTPWQEDEIVVDHADSVHYRLKKVTRSLEFQVLAGDGVSPVHRVTVIDPPRLQRLSARLEFPPYSGLAPRQIENAGDIHALAGTRIDLRIQSSKPLGAASVVLDDTVSVPAQCRGSLATARLRLTRPARYHVELTDLEGVANRAPIEYRLDPLADAPPQVTLVHPGRDIDLPEELQVTLVVEARDDFGILAVELIRRVNEGPEKVFPLPFRAGPQVRVTYPWDLSGVDLLPEDRIVYRVRVRDNDQVSGPKTAVTPEFTLRFPSLYELYKETTSTQDAQLDSLRNVAERGRDTSDYLEHVRRQLLQDEKLTWAQQEKLKATIQQEKERAQAVQDLAQQLQETVDKLQKSGLSSQELMDKLERMRQLMSDVLTPELEKALDELQQALNSEDPEQLAEALRQFNQDQQTFQERLDQTIALLEQVRAEQRLEAAVKQAAELTKRQRQIDRELQTTGTDPRLAKRQAGLKRDTGRLRRELDDLAAAMDKFSPPTGEQLREQAAQMDQRNLTGRMEKMLQQIRARSAAPARRRGQKLEEDLGKLASGLQKLQEDFVAGQKQVLSSQMRRALRGLLNLSQAQERLRDRSARGARRQAQSLAAQQYALMQGAALVAQTLGAVSKRTMAVEPPLATTLGYALRNMQEAADRLAQRSPERARDLQQTSMRYLNEAALMVRQSLSNLAQSRMPSSFGEAMQKMLGLSEQQAQLNQATQEALSAARRPGGGRGRLQRDALRLAAQQRRIYDALEQLQREIRGHRGAQKRVEAIQREMKNALNRLQQHRLDAQTVRQQQRILQRMLDASRSIHTQGENKRRRTSRTGKDLKYTGPAWLPQDLGQADDALRAAMQRALEAPYPDEYHPIIQRYYEQLYQDVHSVGEAQE